jgi:hypothetical protein
LHLLERRTILEMHLKQSIFADSIVNISMAEGVVRFDLVTLAPPNEEKKILAQEVAGVATTLSGFIRMHEQMTKVMEELVKQGILSKADGKTAAAKKVTAE